MTRKVILDCDPGIDDAVALAVALFDPRLEVVAVTAAAGSVSAEQASRNVQAIIEQLDPPRFPRLGTASPPEESASTNSLHVHGEDGLGNTGIAVSRLQHRHPSEKVICDAVRAAPHRVTLVCLGPLTNIARAFQRDPDLPSLVDRIVMTGGTVAGIGDVTAAAEFNMYYDANSARLVFQSPVTKTLIPLDVSRSLKITLDLLDKLPAESTRVGVFLRRILPFYFRAYHQRLGQESVFLHGVVSLASVLSLDLFEFAEMAGDVETRGDLTLGSTIFDRRTNPHWRANMDVAVGMQSDKVHEMLVKVLALAGKATETR